MIRWFKKTSGETVLQMDLVGAGGWRDVPTEVEQPGPRKPREWYLKPREDGGMDWALDSQGPGWVKFREVLEE